MCMLKSAKFKTESAGRGCFLLIAGFASLALLASVYAESVIGLKPCFLCLAQRGLHFILLAFAVLGLSSPWIRLAKRASVVVLLCACAVAGYHTLVLTRVIPDRCATRGQISDVRDFKKLLLSKEGREPCSTSSWNLGNIPAASVNGVCSAALLLALLRRRGSVQNEAKSLHGRC